MPIKAKTKSSRSNRKSSKVRSSPTNQSPDAYFINTSSECGRFHNSILVRSDHLQARDRACTLPTNVEVRVLTYDKKTPNSWQTDYDNALSRQRDNEIFILCVGKGNRYDGRVPSPDCDFNSTRQTSIVSITMMTTKDHESVQRLCASFERSTAVVYAFSDEVDNV